MNMRPSLKELDAYQLADMLTDEHPRLAEPARLSCLLHEGQMRGPRGSKHRTPYAEHPLRATLRLARAGVSDEVTLTAALLHDTVEDCEERLSSLDGLSPSRSNALKALDRRVGPEVARVVDLVSLVRGRPYLEQVTQAVRLDARAFLVKASDWIDNAGSLHHTPKFVKRLAPKYLPVAAVLLDACDLHYVELQTLLDGRLYPFRHRLLRVGYRLDVLSRPPFPGQAEALSAQPSELARSYL